MAVDWREGVVEELNRRVWDPVAAADVLGCTSAHVRWLLRRGKLRGVKMRGRWYVMRESVRVRIRLRLYRRAVGCDDAR